MKKTDFPIGNSIQPDTIELLKTQVAHLSNVCMSLRGRSPKQSPPSPMRRLLRLKARSDMSAHFLHMSQLKFPNYTGQFPDHYLKMEELWADEKDKEVRYKTSAGNSSQTRFIIWMIF